MTATLVTIAKLWHQPRSSSMNGQINKTRDTLRPSHTSTKPDPEEVLRVRSYWWGLGHLERTKKQKKSRVEKEW